MTEEEILKKRHSLPSNLEYFSGDNSDTIQSTKSRRRTSEDFLCFCQIILHYENYQPLSSEESRQQINASPLGSIDSNKDNSSGSNSQSKSNTEEEDEGNEENFDMNGTVEEGWNDISCYCNRPFAGRPMIECSACFTWIHIKCAKIRRGQIPDVWYCSKCVASNPKFTIKASLSNTTTHNISSNNISNSSSTRRKKLGQKRKNKTPVKIN